MFTATLKAAVAYRLVITKLRAEPERQLKSELP